MAHIVRFGAYEADLDSGQLRKQGVRLRLRHQSFEVLTLLVEHPGQVVTREDLRQRLWHDDVCVDFENNLNTAVAQLRDVLCDSADRPRFVETLPKRGYRFIAAVSAPPAPLQPPTRRARLVVLPFVNLSGDPAQEYFGDAMTDEVITALATIAPQQLAVLARTTSMHYKGTDKDVARIARELVVDYAVEGAVRRADGNLEMNLQLIRTSDQAHVFARKYEVPWAQLDHLQVRVANEIAAQLGIGPVATVAAAGPGRRPPSRDVVAYHEYMQGRMSTLGTMESFAAAKRHFENAIARDPEFAPAHDALAELYWQLGYVGEMSPRKAFSAGIVHALRALEIDNTRAETHALLAQFHKTIEYNWAEVHREMALALKLDPNSPLVRARYAISELMPHGHVDEAAAELERALELDPLSAWPRFWLGIVLVLGRHFDRALEESHKSIELDPSSWHAYFVKGVAARYLNTVDECLGALRRSIEFSGGLAGVHGWLGLALGTCGRPAEARDILRQLHAMAAHRYVPPAAFALVHLGLQEIDAAFEWLNRAVDECDQIMLPIKTYGFFDPLRSDPRFSELLRKMNLES